MIRVQLPAHLRSLAGVGREVEVDVADPVTPESIIDALEANYPALRGTIRDHTTHKRRAMVRYFACERDISHEPADTPVPEPIANGSEPFLIIGAISGG
ncbi:MAG TPA: MoaD/ThiS family protein [Thermomicrobiales bacterium]|nr:MoaD/ThiS family protein [Thermomicrobiales bacterium]